MQDGTVWGRIPNVTTIVGTSRPIVVHILQPFHFWIYQLYNFVFQLWEMLVVIIIISHINQKIQPINDRKALPLDKVGEVVTATFWRGQTILRYVQFIQKLKKRGLQGQTAGVAERIWGRLKILELLTSASGEFTAKRLTQLISKHSYIPNLKFAFSSMWKGPPNCI